MYFALADEVLSRPSAGPIMTPRIACSSGLVTTKKIGTPARGDQTRGRSSSVIWGH